MPANCDDTKRASLGRRAALTGLLAASPLLARAQTPAPTPVPASPVQIPQIITPPVPPTGVPVPSTAPRPATPVGAIDKTKAYYLFFDQAIDVNSARALRHQLANLVEAGVSEINLVITSTGGLLTPTLLTYSFIQSLPATINTHAQGVVASAANVLFLAGQTRSADHSAKFLFHPSQLPLVGTLNEQQIREQLTQFDTVDDMVNQIYHGRTKLTDADIKTFSRGEIIYTAEQAEQMAIVQSVADLKLPTAQTARILFMD